MEKQIRLIIAGGGTGGHIFPAVAVGHAVQRLSPDAAILFVGAEGKMEMEKVPQEGFQIIGLPIAGLDRSNFLKNLSLPLKMLKSAIKARNIIQQFQPNIVLGVGGYASFPLLNAAQQLGVPTVIQEQNSYAGKSNKLLAKKAERICVAYDGMDKFFPKTKLMKTGNPVRKSISKATVSQTDARQKLQLLQDKKVLLVVGGSLGAKSINEAVGNGLEALVAGGLQVIWQCGKPYLETAKQQAAPFVGSVQVQEFIRDMATAYAAADFVISRAGALAIAELCIVAKPVVFVPYPFAAEDHQTSNAQALVEKEAAIMVPDKDAATMLVPILFALIADQAKQVRMQEALSALAIDDADERIAKELFELAHVSPQNLNAQ
ncbi:MAG: undecaprenyldiphospho-muramoylpentapeptide beta-N-acetylglucosaminyltransferase [Bacteroidetes bacterium]|nr:undecaprenyldiphospho-muramoylpentapeptide beta-N-acetylglucosaminyltransferase [Bacteroidota bacterium]